MKWIMPIFGALVLAPAMGCEVNRAKSSSTAASERLVTGDSISIPGPYSIASDGTVHYSPVPRPNGHLLGTRNGIRLAQDEVTAWIEMTARDIGGDRVYVRSIIGPYRAEPEYTSDANNPKLYDIVIEIWEPRSNEHDHS